MTQSPNELRKVLDTVAADTVVRAQEMIRSGIDVNAAFRIAIAWEFEVQLKAIYTSANHAAIVDRTFMREILRSILTALRSNDLQALDTIMGALDTYLATDTHPK